MGNLKWFLRWIVDDIADFYCFLKNYRHWIKIPSFGFNEDYEKIRLLMLKVSLIILPAVAIYQFTKGYGEEIIMFFCSMYFFILFLAYILIKNPK